MANYFGLKLHEAWNRMLLPHLGRHPIVHNEVVLQYMARAYAEAGNKKTFIKLFDRYVRQVIIDNPQFLRLIGW